MSVWSYVQGVIEVDTFARSDPEALYIVQTVVNHLPKIHSSEGCAKLYLIRPNGHNMSSNTDEFGDFSNLMDGENYFNTFECQTKVLIVISGNLRDAYFDEALRDTAKMLSRLSSRLYVTSCLVRVESYNDSFIFNDPDWIINMELSDWVDNLFKDSADRRCFR